MCHSTRYPRCNIQTWQANETFSANRLPPYKQCKIPQDLSPYAYANPFQILSMMTNSEEGEESGYWVTPASRLLLSSEPCNIAPFALAMLDPILTDPWHQLEKRFKKKNASPFEMTHGRHFWEYTEHEPRLNDFFNKAMASDAELISRVLVNDCKDVFEGLESLVDVAGGTGTVAKALSGAHPRLKYIVLELPHVIEGLVGSENLRFVGGDIFKSIPQADAVFLKV